MTCFSLKDLRIKKYENDFSFEKILFWQVDFDPTYSLWKPPYNYKGICQEYIYIIY